MSEPLLLPYQAAWVADQSPVKVCEKSRQIGMSWASALEAVLFAMDGSRKRPEVSYVGYNAAMARTFINDCAAWAKAINASCSEGRPLLLDEAKGLLQYSVYFKSGGRINALSSRPENFRSRGGLGIIDEAAFHHDFAGLLKAVVPFLVWGGRVAILSTHNGVDSDFARLVEDIRSRRLKYSLHRTTLDEALEQGLYRRICLALGRVWSVDGERAWKRELYDLAGANAAEEYDCVPNKSGGQYLDPGLIERACADGRVAQFTAPTGFAMRPEAEREAVVRAWLESEALPHLPKLRAGERCVIGEDFGRSADLTVIAPLVISEELHFAAPLVLELRDCPYQQQAQVMRAVADAVGAARISCDATGNGGYIAEAMAQTYGADKVDQIKISRQWYAETFPPLKAAFEDATIKIPRNRGLVSDLASVRVVGGQPALPGGSTARAGEERRHGDFAIALALAYAAARAVAFAEPEIEGVALFA